MSTPYLPELSQDDAQPPWQTAREMLAELRGGRDLLWQMTLRDLRIRYKQAVFGVAWALLMPCLIVAAGFVVKYAMAQTAGTTLEARQVAAVALKAVPWGLFVGAVGFATVSLTNNLNLVTKIYFPREVFPLSALLTQIIDSSIGCAAVVVVLLALRSITWSLNLLWIAPLAVLLVLFTAGACLALSCANLFFRDVRYLVQAALTFGVFFTPVFFDAEQLGRVGCAIVMLNPLTPILEGLRLAVLDGHNLLHVLSAAATAKGPAFTVWHPLYLGYSLVWAVPGTLAAWWTFHKLEFTYAEYI
jgi:ABC-type polysaccharide/polyol phosphate export permease